MRSSTFLIKMNRTGDVKVDEDALDEELKPHFDGEWMEDLKAR